MQANRETEQIPLALPWQGCVTKAIQTKVSMKIKNILFATDLSPSAEKALPYAVQIARRFGSTVYAVHVIQPEVYPAEPPLGWPEIVRAEENLREEGKRHLEDELRGVPHELIFCVGDVWEKISTLILQKDIDLLVLGTRGRSGVSKAAMGSVAEEIFRQATCPVLTVGPRVPEVARHAAAPEPNIALYATDFSPESLAAVPYAISFAREYAAKLILVHSIEKPQPGQISSALQTLRDIVPLGTNLKTQPRCVVQWGTPAGAILRAAADHKADLIVLGIRSAKNHLAATTHFVQSTAYRIVTQATCAVLTVRG